MKNDYVVEQHIRDVRKPSKLFFLLISLGLTLCTLLIILFFSVADAIAGNEPSPRKYSEQRTMRSYKELDMGIQIWTEHEPAWIVEKKYLGRRPVFLTQSPPNAYPPASMSIISYANMTGGSEAFEEYTEIALKQGLRNFGIAPESAVNIERVPAAYGDLSGIELNFGATIYGAAADVKLFIGHGKSRGPVMLQLYTLPGKMSHLGDHIKRSWSNIRYL